MLLSILKRDFRLFLRCILPALALTAVFAAVSAAAAFVASKGAEDSYTPIKTAVVDGESSMFSRILVRTAAETDYIADLLDVQHCSMDEAMEGLSSGELAAAVVLPEGLMDGILTGEACRGEIYLSDSAAAHADIVADVAAFGELLLSAGQNGVFCGQNILRRHELGDAFEAEFLTESNFRLLREASGDVSRYFDVHITDYADTNMSTLAYYAVNYAAFLLLLSPILFHRLYTADLNRPILCRLYAAGLKDAAFLSGKLLYPFLFSALLCLLLYFTAPSVGLLSPLPLLAAAALAALLGGCIMICFDNGTALSSFLALAGLLFSGGIIPRQLLPRVLVALGDHLPFGAVSSLMKPAFGGRISALSLAVCAAYGLFSVLLLRRRMQQIRIGGDAA